jgi:hypothetical protein
MSYTKGLHTWIPLQIVRNGSNLSEYFNPRSFPPPVTIHWLRVTLHVTLQGTLSLGQSRVVLYSHRAMHIPKHPRQLAAFSLQHVTGYDLIPAVLVSQHSG